MATTYSVKVKLIDDEIVYIDGASDYGWMNNGGIPMFYVDKMQNRIFFHAPTVKYIGRAAFFKGEEA